MRRALIIIVAWFAFALLPNLAACDPIAQVAIASPDNSTLATMKVEIANTPGARELGLMYRTQLAENAGMIFVFPKPEAAEFWMKNTIIPLDMLFADSDGKVLGIVANAKPFSETPVGGFSGTLYVLEVNGGYAAAHRIVAGDRMKFSGFDPHTNQ
jgi:uncharacterized membrane protein (UPF0127 family)